jgi:ASC-1-like (ASCH) protein
MKRYILRFRAVDKDNFDEIKDGLRSVETRAGTERYGNIKKGDVLVIVCGEHRPEKKVKRVRHFRSIEALARAIPYKRIMPSVNSLAEIRRAYYSYPGYKEKIKKFGIVAMEI